MNESNENLERQSAVTQEFPVAKSDPVDSQKKSENNTEVKSNKKLERKPEKKSEKKFDCDVMIIGGGLTGLLLASKLSQRIANSPPSSALKIVVMEQSEHLGGHSRWVDLGDSRNSSGLRIVPHELVSDLSGSVQNLPILSPSVHHFEKGQWREFVGFGNEKPQFVEEYEYFLNQKRVLISPEEVMASISLDQVQIETKSLVTELKVENGKISHAVVNSHIKWSAQYFVYAGNIDGLSSLVEIEKTSSKQKQKNQPATAICLDFFHGDHFSPQLPNHRDSEHVSSMIYLNFSEDGKMQPLVGHFSYKEGRPKISQWILVIGDDEAEDSEFVAQQVKWMRKSLKKVWGDDFFTGSVERLMVFPSFSRVQQVPKIKNLASNLLLASAGLAKKCNLLGVHEQVHNVLSDKRLEFTESLSMDQDK